jgi:hypothetical protein
MFFRSIKNTMAQEDGGVTLVIRVIRSFPHRNIRNIVLKNVSLTLTTEELLEKTLAEVTSNTSLPPPFRYLYLSP